MKVRVKIFFLKQEGDPPKLLSLIDIEEDATLETLRRRLEQLNVFKRLGPFKFWDAEEECMIDVDFEPLNSIRDCVHLIPATDDDSRCCKRPRVGDILYGGESVGTAEEVLAQDAHPVLPSTTEPVRGDPASSSRVSRSEEPSVMEGSPMRSTLVPADVLQWYNKAKERLRKDLKEMSMEDHDWSLQSWDQGGLGVIKLYCGECRSLIGGSTGKHTKISVTNLFSNFKKSHLNSASHIRNYCGKRGVEFANHPQASSTRSTPLILTTADHKRMVEEGI
jgi:hypothetical protein